MVSRHACKRYQQRVEPVTQRAAREIILSHERVLEVAASIGAKVVRLGNGSRLVLSGQTVVTVLAKEMRGAA